MGYATDYICEPGTTIIGRKGTIDAPVYVEERFWNVDTAFGLSPGALLHPKFLNYFCQLYDFGAHNRGTTIPSLVKSDLLQIPIPLPPLEEQRRIVAVLDEAFAAIAIATANAEKNLANARKLFKAAFQERFDHVGGGWNSYRLPEICENLDSKRRPVTKSDREPGDIPYYGASGQVDSVQHYLFDDNLLLISEDGANLLMRTYPIAFSISGKSWVNNHAHILRFADMATQRLVEYYFNSISIAPWVSGMAQPKLNQKSLNGIPVPLPPANDRSRLVAELDHLTDLLGRLEHLYETKLAALNSLKQSLMRSAFTGELNAAESRVNDNYYKTPSFTAKVIAFAYRSHLPLGTENTFGRVKAQKALHLCESVGMVDLGRNPMKDAAGPNDFQHMLAAEDWAKANQFFEFEPRRTGSGYTFKKLARFEAIVAEGIAALKPVQGQLEKAIALIAPMKSEQAELLATVHAAWNNLILDNAEATEEAIIYEARENWHASKLKFADSKFREAIATIRIKDIIPDGTAKRVGGQARLL